MRLQNIVVRNYKRLADLDIQVRGHLVLIGANDVGKTSLLRALNLTLGSTAQLYQNLSIADLRDPDESFTVEVLFGNFTPDERALFHREIDIDPTDKSESLKVRLEVSTDPDDAESVQITRWCPGRGEVRNLSRDQVEAFGWRYLPALRQASASSLDGATGVVHSLLKAVESDLGTEKSALGSLLEDFNKNLDGSPALLGLRKGMAEHLSNSMPRTIDAADLAVRTSADPTESVLDNVSMYISRDSAFVPLSEQSDGIRQLISMTLYDLAETAANVIAIDEPEIHLHPQSQRTVAELLSNNATNQKILVTHSPYIVQKFDPEQVVTVRADSTCKQIDPSKVDVEERLQAHWWNPRMLEALTARYVIIVEGIADRIIVEAAAKALAVPLDRIGAVVFELDGADKFRSVYKLLGKDGFNIEVLGLVDDKEKGSWLSAVGGKEKSIIGKTVFVSSKDLEDEYCRGLDPDVLIGRLISGKLVRDEKTLLGACGLAAREELTPEALAHFCRSNGGASIGNRKVPAALAVSKGLTKAEATSISSISALLAELSKRAAS